MPTYTQSQPGRSTEYIQIHLASVICNGNAKLLHRAVAQSSNEGE